MSANLLQVPEITDAQKRSIRSVALDPDSRPLVERLLSNAQKTVLLAAEHVESLNGEIRRLEVERQRWQQAHESCVQREQMIQVILDETQKARRV